MRTKIKGSKHGAKDAIKSTGGNLKNIINEAKGTKKELTFLGVSAAILVITSIFSVSFAINSKIGTAINTAYEALDSDLIYNGVFIEDVNISGLTKEQAIRRGTAEYAGRRLGRTFTISYGTYSKDVTYEDLGGSYDIEKTVDEAYKLGRSGSKEKRIEFTNNLEDRREYLVSSLEIDESKMKSTLNEIAKEVEALDNVPGKVDIDTMMNFIEENMRIGQEDLEFNIAFK